MGQTPQTLTAQGLARDASITNPVILVAEHPAAIGLAWRFACACCCRSVAHLNSVAADFSRNDQTEADSPESNFKDN
jgi:hypothetical protein